MNKYEILDTFVANEIEFVSDIIEEIESQTDTNIREYETNLFLFVINSKKKEVEVSAIIPCIRSSLKEESLNISTDLLLQYLKKRKKVTTIPKMH